MVVVQYGYSILSILSGIVALIITAVVTTASGAISLARLDVRKIPIDFISQYMEPSFRAFCAALMMDHDNTNPIKFTALEWFCDRLKTIRKAEVHQCKRNYMHLPPTLCDDRVAGVVSFQRRKNFSRRSRCPQTGQQEQEITRRARTESVSGFVAQNLSQWHLHVLNSHGRKWDALGVIRSRVRSLFVCFRFHLWVLMSQNPSLRKFRKKAIEKVLDELQKTGKVDGNPRAPSTALCDQLCALLVSYLLRRISKAAR
jgi:hypothetical protein